MSNDVIRQESRRDLLKKGAAIGAVAWTAPMLISSPAFAATAKCGGSKPCTTYYFTKTGDNGQENGDTSDGACPITIKRCDNTTVASFVNGNQFVAVSHSGTVGTFQFSAGTVPLAILLKPGNDCYRYSFDASTMTLTPIGPDFCVGATINISGSIASGINITVNTAPCDNNGISHVAAYFCR